MIHCCKMARFIKPLGRIPDDIHIRNTGEPCAIAFRRCASNLADKGHGVGLKTSD